MRRPYEFERTPSGDTSLRDALGAYLAQQGLNAATRLGEVASCWDNLVGPEISAHVVPWRLDADELVVAVDDPAWATEVGFLAERILKGLSEQLGAAVASRVKVHVRLSFDLD